MARRRDHDLSERQYFVEADFVVYPKGIKLEEIKGSDILLAIEVALTSLDYDRGLYARYTVNELWSHRRRLRLTFVHSHPEGEGWRSIVEPGPDAVLTFAALPGF